MLIYFKGTSHLTVCPILIHSLFLTLEQPYNFIRLNNIIIFCKKNKWMDIDCI